MAGRAWSENIYASFSLFLGWLLFVSLRSFVILLEGHGTRTGTSVHLHLPSCLASVRVLHLCFVIPLEGHEKKTSTHHHLPAWLLRCPSYKIHYRTGRACNENIIFLPRLLLHGFYMSFIITLEGRVKGASPSHLPPSCSASTCVASLRWCACPSSRLVSSARAAITVKVRQMRL